MTADRLEVLIRAADAGDTFLSWTWLRPPWKPQTTRRRASALCPVLGELDQGLLIADVWAEGSLTSDGKVSPIALTSGPFSGHAHECRLAERLTTALLPKELGDQILREADTHAVRIRITPSPRLSRVPWETLLLPDGRRLIEAVEIVLDPPAAIYADRSRNPEPWVRVADGPVLYVVDPVLVDPTKQLLSNLGRLRFADRIAELRDRGRVPLDDVFEQAPRTEVTRDLLSSALRPRTRSRLFYFGHVSSDPDDPGTAALHLSDRPNAFWGLADPVAGNLPLSALDLLLGTSNCNDPDEWWNKYLSDTAQLGHEIWPMPSRVALVACEGSVDFRSVETFGLVIAILNAGAELVTTTRWPLPTDTAFRHASVPEDCLPTTELALQVDEAHETTDPVDALRRWQCVQLEMWNQTEGDIQYSPITWAALTNTYAPRRHDA